MVIVETVESYVELTLNKIARYLKQAYIRGVHLRQQGLGILYSIKDYVPDKVKWMIEEILLYKLQEAKEPYRCVQDKTWTLLGRNPEVFKVYQSRRDYKRYLEKRARQNDSEATEEMGFLTKEAANAEVLGDDFREYEDNKKSQTQQRIEKIKEAVEKLKGKKVEIFSGALRLERKNIEDADETENLQEGVFVGRYETRGLSLRNKRRYFYLKEEDINEEGKIGKEGVIEDDDGLILFQDWKVDFQEKSYTKKYCMKKDLRKFLRADMEAGIRQEGIDIQLSLSAPEVAGLLIWEGEELTFTEDAEDAMQIESEVQLADEKGITQVGSQVLTHKNASGLMRRVLTDEYKYRQVNEELRAQYRGIEMDLMALHQAVSKASDRGLRKGEIELATRILIRLNHKREELAAYVMLFEDQQEYMIKTFLALEELGHYIQERYKKESQEKQLKSAEGEDIPPVVNIFQNVQQRVERIVHQSLMLKLWMNVLVDVASRKVDVMDLFEVREDQQRNARGAEIRKILGAFYKYYGYMEVYYMFLKYQETEEGRRAFLVGLAEMLEGEGVGRVALADLIEVEISKKEWQTGHLDGQKEAIVAIGSIAQRGEDETVAKEAVSLLKEALNHNSDTLRIESARALGEYGTLAKDVLVDLIKKEDDSNGEVREAVGKAYNQIMKAINNDGGRAVIAAVEILREAFNQEDDKIRKRIVQTIAELGDSKAVIMTLQQALKDEKLDVRLEAAMALGRIGRKTEEKEVLMVFEEALESEETQITAVNAMGEIWEQHGEMGPNVARLVPKIIELLRSTKEPQEGLEEAAIETLPKFGEKAKGSLVKLRYIMDQGRSEEEKAKAAQAYKQVMEGIKKSRPTVIAESIEVVAQDLKNSHAAVHSRAAKVLYELGDSEKTVGALTEAIEDEVAGDNVLGVKLEAAIALGRLRPELVDEQSQVMSILREAMEYTEPRINTRAIQGIGEILAEAKEGVPALSEFIEVLVGNLERFARGGTYKELVAETLSQFKAEASDAIFPLKKIMSNEEEKPEIRDACIRAYDKIMEAIRTSGDESIEKALNSLWQRWGDMMYVPNRSHIMLSVSEQKMTVKERKMIVEAIIDLGKSESTIKALNSIIAADLLEVKMHAAKGLVSWGIEIESKTLVSAIEKKLTSEHEPPEDKIAIIKQIGEIGEVAGEATRLFFFESHPWEQYCYESHRYSEKEKEQFPEELRQAAIETLGKIGSAQYNLLVSLKKRGDDAAETYNQIIQRARSSEDRDMLVELAGTLYEQSKYASSVDVRLMALDILSDLDGLGLKKVEEAFCEALTYESNNRSRGDDEGKVREHAADIILENFWPKVGTEQVSFTRKELFKIALEFKFDLSNDSGIPVFGLLQKLDNLEIVVEILKSIREEHKDTPTTRIDGNTIAALMLLGEEQIGEELIRTLRIALNGYKYQEEACQIIAKIWDEGDEKTRLLLVPLVPMIIDFLGESWLSGRGIRMAAAETLGVLGTYAQGALFRLIVLMRETRVRGAQKQERATYENAYMNIIEALKGLRGDEILGAVKVLRDGFKEFCPPQERESVITVQGFSISKEKWNEQIRIKVVETLEELPDSKETREALQEALDDEDLDVKMKAAVALGKRKSWWGAAQYAERKKLIQVLTKALDERSEASVIGDIFEAVGEEAEGLVEATRGPLIELLKDDDISTNIRIVVAEVLGKFEIEALKAVPWLRCLSKEGFNDEIRNTARKAQDRIMEKAKDLDEGGISGAIKAIQGSVEDWSTEQSKWVKREELEMEATEAIIELGDSDPVKQELLRILEDGNQSEDIRLTVAIALGKFGIIIEEMIYMLRRRLEDNKVLEVRNAKKKKMLLTGAEVEAYEKTWELIDVMGEKGRQEAMIAFRRALKDEGPMFRIEALDAIGELSTLDNSEGITREIVQALQEALDDEHPAVQEIGAEVLGDLGTIAEDTLPWLRRLMKSDAHYQLALRAHLRIVRAIIEASSEMETELSSERMNIVEALLEEMLKEEGERERQKFAVQGLRRFVDGNTTAPLEAVLRSDASFGIKQQIAGILRGVEGWQPPEGISLDLLESLPSDEELIPEEIKPYTRAQIRVAIEKVTQGIRGEEGIVEPLCAGLRNPETQYESRQALLILQKEGKWEPNDSDAFWMDFVERYVDFLHKGDFIRKGKGTEDKAMMASLINPTGGIDLDTQQMEMIVKQEGGGIEWDISTADMAILVEGNFQGLVPEIVGMSKTNIPVILGLTKF